MVVLAVPYGLMLDKTSCLILSSIFCCSRLSDSEKSTNAYKSGFSLSLGGGISLILQYEMVGGKGFWFGPIP
jgi:hypothetical protein